MKTVRLLTGSIIVMLLSLTISCSSGSSLEQNTPNHEQTAVADTTVETQTEPAQSIEPDSSEEIVSPDIESNIDEEIVPSDIQSDITEETASPDIDQEEIMPPDEPEQQEIPDTADAPQTAITIEIQGSAEFIEQTEQALLLLREKDITSFNTVQEYIGIIVQGEHSGMWAYENPPRYEVGDATAFYSITWYAGTLVHDATHSEMYHTYLSENGAPVPSDVWTGTEAEMICILKQIDAAKAINAPQSEIDYLESLNGEHYDTDGDGDLDWDDYYNRDW